MKVSEARQAKHKKSALLGKIQPARALRRACPDHEFRSFLHARRAQGTDRELKGSIETGLLLKFNFSYHNKDL